MDRENQPGQSLAKQSPPSEIPPTANLPAVVIDEEGSLLARWVTQNPTFASNMEVVSPSGRALLTRCLAKTAMKTRNAVGRVMEVVGYFAHEVEILEKETGEYERKLRAVMVLKDGTLISTMSGPVLGTLCTIARIRGRGNWEPPSLLEIREWPLEDGASYCDLIEHEPDTTDPKKGKK